MAVTIFDASQKIISGLLERREARERFTDINTRTLGMSTALISAFYDINDVIQQGKQRPSSLDLHNSYNLAQRRSESLISRRHSTTSTSTQKTFNGTSFFSNMPGSPKTNQENYNKAFAFPQGKERSMSIGAGEESDGQHRKQRVSTNSSRYKTELCRPYEENGTCKYGDKCQFAHGIHELRSLNRHPKYKTELCRTFHTIGFCPYGPRCHFVHKAEELEKPPSQESRSESASTVGSAPPSPTPSLDSPNSPFVNIPTPNTPSIHGDVFVFGEESSSSSPTSSSGSSGSTSPVEMNSPFGSSHPESVHIVSKVAAILRQPGSSLTGSVPSSPSLSSSGERSPGIPDSASPPDAEFDAFGRRRLPIFNKIA